MIEEKDVDLSFLEKDLSIFAPWFNYNENEVFLLLKEFFKVNLFKATELSFTPGKEGIGMLVKGKGEEFISHVITVMEKIEISQKSIEIFKKIDQHFPNINLLAKFDFSPEGTKINFYYHYAPPILQVVKLLSLLMEVPPSKFGICFEASKLLKMKTSFLTGSLKKDSPFIPNLFFINSVEKTGFALYPGLSALMAKLGLDSDQINFFIETYPYLTKKSRNIFTSLGFADGQLAESTEIYYENTPIELVTSMLFALTKDENSAKQVSAIAEKISVPEVSYIGIRFSNKKMPQMKLYFNRRYCLMVEDNTEGIIDLLENEQWA